MFNLVGFNRIYVFEVGFHMCRSDFTEKLLEKVTRVGRLRYIVHYFP